MQKNSHSKRIKIFTKTTEPSFCEEQGGFLDRCMTENQHTHNFLSRISSSPENKFTPYFPRKRKMSEDSGIVYKMNASAPFEFYEKRQNIIKEMVVAIEHKNIIREQLAQCARDETVNQFRNCRELVEKYMAIQKDKYHGMIFPEGEEPKNRGNMNMIQRK